LKNSSLPVLILLSASTLWGLTWLPLKHFGRFGVEGPTVTLFAHGTVGLFAVPFLWRQRAAWRGSLGTMAWLGFLGGLANLAFASAIVLGDVMRVMVLFYLLPAWGVLGARLLLGERIDQRRGLSLAAALGGAFFVLGGTKILEQPPSWVDAVAALSGLALATNNVVFRKASDVPVASKVGFVFVGSLLWALLVTLASPSFVMPAAPPLIWTEVVLFGVIWILAATAGTLFGVHHLEAGRSSVLIIMELVTAVVSAAWIGGKIPSAVECAGGVLILTSGLLEALRAEPAAV
jgi:drug/metabolite transporter (DMT)-like permease